MTMTALADWSVVPSSCALPVASKLTGQPRAVSFSRVIVPSGANFTFAVMS